MNVSRWLLCEQEKSRFEYEQEMSRLECEQEMYRFECEQEMSMFEWGQEKSRTYLVCWGGVTTGIVQVKCELAKK